MLEIKTFGGISILRDRVEINDLGSRKAEALLVYLAIEGGQHPRTILAAMFWPESSQEQASRSLRVVLSTLRKTFNPYLEINRISAGINNVASIQVDVLELEEKLSRNQIDHALELYRGDFLDGFCIPDSLAFEDWRLLEQERIRRLITEALHAKISINLKKGETTRGLELSQHLLRLDPLDELAHQQRMMLFALNGQRSAAMLHYEQFSELLQSELEVSPSEETRELFDQISGGDRLSKTIPFQPKHNLPAQQTSFIGREEQRSQIGEMMADPHCRLITLTGPGGIGKTRLALEVAFEHLHSFEDGTYFVPLGSIQSPDALLSSIAHTLSFSYDVAATLDPKSQLLDYLRHRSILLVMDSFEHLIEGAGLLSEILTNAANLKLLVTSREHLGLQAEWAFRLDGLPIAENVRIPDVGDNSALALFCERGRQAKADFQLHAIDRQHAIQICRLVEGMPLGIELAAAWVSVLSCEEISQELEKNLDFLSASIQDPSMTRPSMRSAFDHSWCLLSEEQQDILRKLSIFRGAFSRSAALQILGADLPHLSSLIGKSLLRRNASGLFEMHELVRQYAAEKLDENMEMKEEAQARHADYYIGLLSQRESELMGSRMTRVKTELHREVGNIRIAAKWAILTWDTEAALKALERFFNYFVVQGWHEGREVFDGLAVEAAEPGRSKNNHTPLQNPVYLSIRSHQAFFCCNLGLIDESEAYSQECLVSLRRLKMRNEISLCLHNLGVNDCFRGDYLRSIQRLEESIDLGRTFQTIAWRSYFLWLGYVYFMIGEYDRGMESLQTCYDLFAEIGSLWGEAFALSKMGMAADGLKDHTQAMQYHQQAVSIFETTRDQAGRGYALSRMSMSAYLVDHYQDALRLGKEGYDAFNEISHRWGICISLCRLGFAHLGLGEITNAKDRLYEALLLAQENEMTPLILHAVAGLACAFAMEGEKNRALKLYQFVRTHPQIPALYLNMTDNWFSKMGLVPPADRADATEPDAGDRILDQVVASILRERDG